MKSILSHLPEDGDGRVKIDEFFKTEIKSAEAFKVRQQLNYTSPTVTLIIFDIYVFSGH